MLAEAALAQLPPSSTAHSRADTASALGAVSGSPFFTPPPPAAAGGRQSPRGATLAPPMRRAMHNARGPRPPLIKRCSSLPRRAAPRPRAPPPRAAPVPAGPRRRARVESKKAGFGGRAEATAPLLRSAATPVRTLRSSSGRGAAAGRASARARRARARALQRRGRTKSLRLSADPTPLFARAAAVTWLRQYNAMSRGSRCICG